jgi:acyl-CoA synthetase (AMP-forming)/AMP-acid ligase II
VEQRALDVIIEALDTDADRFGDLVGGSRLSGRELLADARRKAEVVAGASGASGADRVVVAVPRALDRQFLAWVIGTHLAGGVVAPLYPTLRPNEREAVLSVLQPDFIVADPAAADADKLSGFAFDAERGAFTAVARPQRAPLPPKADLVLYSSGSTGQPKGILVNGESFLRSASLFGSRLGLADGDRYFCPLPMAHSGGLIMGWWASALHHAVLLGSTSNDFGVVARRLAEVRPEFVGAVDTFFYRWEQATGGQARLGRVAWTTGDARTLERVQRGCGFEHVVRPYGLTEASPNVGVGDPNRTDGPLADARIWVHEGVQVRIDTAVIEDDENDGQGVGEILVTGACVSPGYLMPEGIVSVADAEGWIHTGDLGYFEDDGALQFVGRLKEMLKVGGLNVWPQEIEAVLQGLDIERPMCVVGLRDDEYGELPVLVVEGALADEERARVDKAVSALPRIKRPRQVIQLDAFPVTPSGKMDRRTITKLVNEA